MSESNFDVLFWVPPWLIAVVLFVVLMIAAAIGRRIGLAGPHEDLSKDTFDLTVIESAILGLLGLLIAFTYSFVTIRDDHRRAAIIGEANALGTAYLRADLAPEPARTELRDLLRQYTRTRILSAAAVRTPARYDAALAESLSIQNRLWPTAAGSLRGRTPTIVDALLLQSINEVIDSHGRRIAATRDRLPAVVILMVTVVAIAAIALTGYSGGIAAKRKSWLTTTLAVTISLVMFIILDLDHPRVGLIRVSQQALVDTLQGMEPMAVPTTAPAGGG